MTATLEAPTSFDVCGPLPTGTTVLEASAGTGKTYTIAALAARYVAEGHATLPQVMLVTFGREATRELRERVRERFVRTERGLADPEAARAGDDPVTRLLADADDDVVAARRARLTSALAGFDAATIATTHQFCQDMLTGLGIVGDTDPDGTFVERIDDVVTEVVDDFYLRKYAIPGAPAPDFDRKTALLIGQAVVGDPSAGIAPDHDIPGAAGARASFARAVRAEVEKRKRRRRLFTFDDMLTRLRNALVDPRLGPAACQRLRDRFSVVLVDEFQDTDPIQWEILRVAFHGHSALTFIGDPKQAIYAFRGADVVSYLQAVESAGTKSGLATNWRSDAALVRALDTIFNRAALGDEKIVVPPVASAHPGRRLVGAPRPAPFRLRVLPREGLRSTWKSSLPIVGGVREKVAADLAADIAELVAADSRWEESGRADPTLGPGDIAVLVRTNANANLVREALTAAGVPSVLAGATSVFTTESAEEWLTLLEAVEQPGRPALVRAAALTVFLGHAAADLDAHADAVLPEVGASLRRWGAVLHDRGVAAFLEAVAAETGLAARVLARVDGERRITDVRHIGQVLHAAAVESRLGVVALVEWLRARMAEAAAGTGELRPERSRRLESDASAVQVLTIHKCKGLEYPVVYVPFGWDRWVSDEPTVVTHHDEAGKRVRAVGGDTDPAWRDHVAAARDEDDGEDLRLLYVALTRAQGQVVCWWAPSTNTKPSAVHRLFVGRPAPGTSPDRAYPVWEDERVLAHLEALAGDDIAVERVESRRAVPYVPAAGSAHALAVAPFDRPLDLAWRRSSYSSLTAGAHGPGPVGSEPEERQLADEADPEDPVTPAPPPPADDVEAMPSPMADLPVGAAFGTLVHSVLETVDTGSGDLHGALLEAAGAELGHRPHAEVDAATLADALLPVMRTPLPPGGPATLADVAPRDRLAELDFELPLAGGDRTRPGAAAVTLSAVAALLRRHLPADDPLAGYPDALDHPGAHGLGEQVLRGYLTGSIDGVLRGPDGRFVVVDYKTNWLGPVGPTGRAPLTAAHYGPTSMATAMIAAHYPLQAILYAVALHRFLRWRLRGYDPHAHLGGVLYLFLRGMCGADTPVVDGTTCGVFAWNPPPALVVELSALLDGGTR
ncbi:UvrD-helicase domain-containing protein [Actinomycetospora flava]|uniref:RecBCD enzyme subunit RecB n=1 Tax=Actinomycetospora flava TaxID=3129232 RepID=A0ABU8M617_9PSEU